MPYPKILVQKWALLLKKANALTENLCVACCMFFCMNVNAGQWAWNDEEVEPQNCGFYDDEDKKCWGFRVAGITQLLQGNDMKCLQHINRRNWVEKLALCSKTLSRGNCLVESLNSWTRISNTNVHQNITQEKFKIRLLVSIPDQ